MKRFLLACIRFYRRQISPRKPPCCRYIPTCSSYAVTAITRYGALKGGLMAAGVYCAAILSARAAMILCPKIHL